MDCLRIYSKTVQFTLLLGSTVQCTNDCRFSDQATVRWTHKSYCRAVFIQADEEEWNQLQVWKRGKDFALSTKGRGRKLEELLHSRAEWEIWKGSVGKNKRKWIRVWLWGIIKKGHSTNNRNNKISYISKNFRQIKYALRVFFPQSNNYRLIQRFDFNKSKAKQGAHVLKRRTYITFI